MKRSCRSRRSLVSGKPMAASLPPSSRYRGSSDTLSPYAHQKAFVEALRKQGTEAVLETIDDPRWQHMVGTVTLHRKDPDAFMPLKRLFSWLSGIEAKAEVSGNEHA